MHCNAQMGRSEVVKYCQLDAAAQNVMERYFKMLNLSARSHDRILKVARTIADLAGSENIEAVHLAEPFSCAPACGRREWILSRQV